MVEYLEIIIQKANISNFYLAVGIFLFLHVLFATLFIPCSPLTVLSGVIWGNYLGLLFSVTGSLLSFFITFVLSRFLIKKNINFIKNKIPKKILLLEVNLKTLFFVQTNPIFPASSAGYFFGLSKITLWKYLFFAIIFNMPLQILLISLGNYSFKITYTYGWSISLVVFCLFYFVIKKILIIINHKIDVKK